jgi:hypothetical protein
MKPLLCPSAYVHFTCHDPLLVLAERLSKDLFGGIEFVGLNTGIWDEVPAVRLARDFLGLSVELGGSEDVSYTIQIEADDFPWEFVRAEDAATTQVDLAGFVGYLLQRIEGIELIDPK